MVAALARQNYFTEAVANNKGLTLYPSTQYPSTQQCQLSMYLVQVLATFKHLQTMKSLFNPQLHD